MFVFADYNENAIQKDADLFFAQQGIPGTYALSCIHKNTDIDRNQMVFLLQHENGQKFALKKDFKHVEPWIEQEFKLFKRLRAHFDTCDHSSVIEPLFLAPDKSFHVTRYVQGKTAAEMLRYSTDAKQKLQVFRRAGRWLDTLHRHKDPQPEKIWMNWIFDKLTGLQAWPDRYATAAQYHPFLERLQEDAQQFQASLSLRVLSHGDFHSSNLILAPGGMAIGLDLAYATTKPCIYDIVDFLKEDVLSEFEDQDIGAGGIQRNAIEYFFKTYRFKQDIRLLNFHLRARLLTSLLSIGSENGVLSKAKQKRFEQLHRRLGLAFEQNLTE